MLFAIAIMILLLLFPNQAALGAQSGLRLCATAVIPALFPFLTASKLLTTAPLPCRRLANFFCMNENVFNALIVSFLGGYPIGVVTLCGMYEEGRIKKHEAESAIKFCNNSGPGFFIGMIGGAVFKDVRIGLLLYFIHVLSAIVCIGTNRNPKTLCKIQRQERPDRSFARLFTEAVTASVAAMINICALVVLFSVLNAIVSAFGILSYLPHTVRSVLFGMLELTGGISMLKEQTASLAACAFLMGWGGLCVHMQAASIWQKAGLKVKGYYAQKLLHGVVSAVFALLWLQSRAVFLLCAAICAVICVIYPQIHQKWGRKKKKVIV